MESFHEEKEKYVKLTEKEAKLKESFKHMQKQYSDYKGAIDRRKEKESKIVCENENLQKRLKQLTLDELQWEEKKNITKKMLDQVQVDNHSLGKHIETLQNVKKALLEKLAQR